MVVIAAVVTTLIMLALVTMVTRKLMNGKLSNHGTRGKNVNMVNIT
jgi:Tfp pilus assembly protein PilV